LRFFLFLLKIPQSILVKLDEKDHMEDPKSMEVGLIVELQRIAKNENEAKGMKQVHKDVSQYPLQ